MRVGHDFFNKVVSLVIEDVVGTGVESLLDLRIRTHCSNHASPSLFANL